jgi:predicted transposase/invertase (TIGR01784 family)
MQYSELRKTIGINILDYNFLKQTEKYHTVFHLREETENFKLTDVEEIRFIELPKMLKNWERGMEKGRTEAKQDAICSSCSKGLA